MRLAPVLLVLLAHDIDISPDFQRSELNCSRRRVGPWARPEAVSRAVRGLSVGGCLLVPHRARFILPNSRAKRFGDAALRALGTADGGSEIDTTARGACNAIRSWVRRLEARRATRASPLSPCALDAAVNASAASNVVASWASRFRSDVVRPMGRDFGSTLLDAVDEMLARRRVAVVRGEDRSRMRTRAGGAARRGFGVASRRGRGRVGRRGHARSVRAGRATRAVFSLREPTLSMWGASVADRVLGSDGATSRLTRRRC